MRHKEILRRKRLIRKLWGSNKACAEALGVTPSAVSAFIRGRYTSKQMTADLEEVLRDGKKKSA